MRYSKNETTTLVGIFDTQKSVTIKVINIATDTKINTATNECVESVNIVGAYRWNTDNITDTFEEPTSLMYEMCDGEKKFYGKFVYSDNNATFENIEETKNNITNIVASGNQDIEGIIKDIQLGNWEIKDKQMIMLRQNGEELARFNLFDLKGNRSMTSIFKRELLQ